MTSRQSLAFVRRHGVVLMSARGPVPSLAEAIAGGPIRGSWWGHPQSHHMFRVFEAVSDSDDVLVCRLVAGKVTFVHRRLWPALVRLAGELPKPGLAAVREEHTAAGHHRAVVTPFPRWVPAPVLKEGRGLSRDDAAAQLGAGLLQALAAKKSPVPRGAGRSTMR